MPQTIVSTRTADPPGPPVAGRLGSALDLLEVLPAAVEIASTAPASERPAMTMVGAIVLALAVADQRSASSGEHDAMQDWPGGGDAGMLEGMAIHGWELVELSQCETARAVRSALDGLVALGWLDTACRPAIDRVDGEGQLDVLHLVPGPALVDFLTATESDGDRPFAPFGR